MTKFDKLIQKILAGKSIITIDEAEKLLLKLDFIAENISGSHITYRKENISSVTLVLRDTELKPYMIKKLYKTLKEEGY